jgi:hypothetical protein
LTASKPYGALSLERSWVSSWGCCDLFRPEERIQLDFNWSWGGCTWGIIAAVIKSYEYFVGFKNRKNTTTESAEYQIDQIPPTTHPIHHQSHPLQRQVHHQQYPTPAKLPLPLNKDPTTYTQRIQSIQQSN